MGKESKKKNSETNAKKEVSDCAGTVHTITEDGFKQSKEDKRQKKYKKRTEVSTTVELDGYHNEHLSVKHSEKADDDSKRKKKEKEKEKKRKLEPLEDNCKADKEIHMVGEECNLLQADYGKDLGHDNEVRSRKQKKRHKEGSKKDLNGSLSFQVETLKDKEGDKYEGVKEQSSSQNDNIAQMKNGIEHIDKKKKKNKKGRRDKEVVDLEGKKTTIPLEEVGDLEGKMTTIALEEVGKVRENCDIDVSEKVEKKREKVEKKRKKGNKEDKDGSGGAVRESMAKELGKEGTVIEDKDLGDNNENAHLIGKKKKEKVTKNGNKGKRKKLDSVEACPEDPSPKVKPKKVRFSGHVEVFPSSDGPSKGKGQNQEDGLLHGKRFTPEEDERIKEVVKNYIRTHNLDEKEGKHMILNCKSYPQVKNCWKDIGAAFHNRTVKAIYYRAHTLLEYENESNEKRSWTEDEFEQIRRFHEKNGPKWKQLADALQAHRVHVKDTWRRIKFPNKKMGHWSQDEYQSLFDLVNTDLQARAFEEKKSKYGMLRDNISWTAISDKLSTRTDAICCTKWYSQLTSPMVAEGDWADTDDYRMLDALYSLDACCIEDVDWDNLLDHRSGYICRKRWNQMVSHIGEHGNKSFTEQVEVLSKRYCPDLLEVEELAFLVKDNLPCKHLVLSKEEAFINFLQEDPSLDGVLELEPMNAYNRLLLHRLADIFGFSHRSVGEGDDRHLILECCPETSIPPVLVSDLLWQYDGVQPPTTSHQLLTRNQASTGLKAGKTTNQFSLEEREAAYLAARERIFTGYDGETSEPMKQKPRSNPVVARRMIAHALGGKINPSNQALSLRDTQEYGEVTNEKNIQEKEQVDTNLSTQTHEEANILSTKIGGTELGDFKRSTPPGTSRPRRSVVGGYKENLKEEHMGAAKRMFAHALGRHSAKDRTLSKCSEMKQTE